MTNRDDTTTDTSQGFPQIPFNLSSLEYTDSYDSDSKHQGNCGTGPVDATRTNDAGCNEQGSQCAITHTRPGEWLAYLFEADSDVIVDVSLRIASPSTTKKIRVEIDSAQGYQEVLAPVHLCRMNCRYRLEYIAFMSLLRKDRSISAQSA